MIERATVAVLCRPVRLLRKTFIAGTLLSTIVMIVATSAQSDYPNRPVQLIVPYGAGGIADVGMRILADQLTGRLKQQFVVENRPGAGGILAAKAAASAAPDGYTVLMTGNNNAISASLFKSLPYNILTDFASTSTTSFFDLLIVTRAGSPLQSVEDIVKMARVNPGTLNIATINPGSTQNLAALAAPLPRGHDGRSPSPAACGLSCRCADKDRRRSAERAPQRESPVRLEYAWPDLPAGEGGTRAERRVWRLRNVRLA